MGYPEDGTEIRGCQFASTVFRELYNQAHVNELLKEHKLSGGNIPRGLWEYADESYGVKKYCAIFETLGDMRLGTHLFQGLHRLIWDRVRAKGVIGESAMQELVQLFTKRGRVDSNGEVKEGWHLKITRD